MSNETNAIANFDQDLFALGYEGFITSGPPPVKSIILLNSQKQCADAGLKPDKMGKFLDTATNELHDTLDVVIMKISTARTWQTEFNDPNKQTFCYSRDGLKPSITKDKDGNTHNYPVLRGQELRMAPDAVSCAACPHSQWADKKVDCKESYRLTVMMPDGTPRLLRVKGTSIKPIRTYIQTLQARRQPLPMNRVTITPEFVSGPQGAYCVLKPQLGVQTDAAMLAMVKDWLLTWGKAYDAAASQHAEEHEESVDLGSGTVINTTATTAEDTEIF